MPTSHLLVLQSLIYILLFGSALLFYRFVFPKKHISLFTLFLVIALLPIMSIFRPGTYESGDLSIHIMETMSFYNFLTQGNLYPIWAGEMNATYGYPAFLFTYPLPFYLMSVLHFFGLSFMLSAKVFLAASYVLSGIFMYLWLKKEVGERGAFIGGLFYLFAPYHLIDLHFRVDIGEVLAFVFLPLSLLAARNLINTGQSHWFLLEIVALSGLIISHPAISIMGLPVIMLYIFLLILQKSKRITLLMIQLLTVVLSVLLTTFYWFSVITHLRFTHNATFSHALDFLTLNELLYSPWRYGLLFQGSFGELSFLLGYAHSIVIILAVVLLVRQKINPKKKSLLIVSLLTFIFLAFMTLENSRFLWEVIPFIDNFQFTYRLLGIIIFILAVIAAIVVDSVKSNKLLVILAVIAIFSTVLNWGHRKNLPEVTDATLRAQIPYTATNGGAFSQAVTQLMDPKDPFAKIVPKKHIEVLQGEGSVKEVSRINTNHTYFIEAKTDMQLRENTLYFPGWNLFIDQAQQPITVLTTASPSGIISFTVPPGKHTVALLFQDTEAVKIGKFISGITLLFIIFMIFARKYFIITIKKRN